MAYAGCLYIPKLHKAVTKVGKPRSRQRLRTVFKPQQPPIRCRCIECTFLNELHEDRYLVGINASAIASNISLQLTERLPLSAVSFNKSTINCK